VFTKSQRLRLRRHATAATSPARSQANLE